MDMTSEDFDHELEDLKKELENFQKEKEVVRAIVGKIGGVPTFHTKIVNTIFIVIIVGSLLVSIFGHSISENFHLIMIEFATVALSVKILYMMHCQNRVNHFQLWMQSSIEWRINEIIKIVRRIDSKK